MKRNRLGPQRLRWTARVSRTARLAAVVLLLATGVTSILLSMRTYATGPYAAPLPSPLLVVQGVGSANTAHLFVDRTWDFGQMRQGFNTVNISPGDQSAVTAARNAGLAVILEFDYKTDFMSGKDISSKVNAIVSQVQANPGTISGIWVADRLNEKYSGTQGLNYLAATGGVFHSQIPGVPVFVDVSDWELTCNQPQQSSCTSSLLTSTYQYETNAVLTSFYQSGNIDGLFIADNLQNNNATAQTAAWNTARALWPPPFIAVSRAAQLSFNDNVYTGNTTTANNLAIPYMDIPMQAGADGLALWAWHQVFQGTISTFLNKDTSSNAIWQTILARSNSFGLVDITAPSVSVSSPTANATAVGDLVLAVQTADNKGVSKIEYYVDGNLIASTTTPPFQYEWDTHNVADGTHQFTAKAYDAAGNAGTSSILSAIVSNNGSPPSNPPPSNPPPPDPGGTGSSSNDEDITPDIPASSDGSDVAADLGSEGPVGEEPTTANTTTGSDTVTPTIRRQGTNTYTANVKVPVTTNTSAISVAARSIGLLGGMTSLMFAGVIFKSLF